MPISKPENKIQALISMNQLAQIKALFSANNAEFHIKEDTSDFVWVYFYGLSRSARFLVTGWDNAEACNNQSYFFTEIYSAMEKALSQRENLPCSTPVNS